MPTTETTPRQYRRITGQERDDLAAELARRYENGASIRSLVHRYGMPYGTAHRLLTEAGVVFRGQGGARPTRPAR